MHKLERPKTIAKRLVLTALSLSVTGVASLALAAPSKLWYNKLDAFVPELPSNIRYTHAIDFDALRLESKNAAGAGIKNIWTEAAMRENYQKMANTYAACGIKIEKVQFYSAEVPHPLWLKPYYAFDHRRVIQFVNFQESSAGSSAVMTTDIASEFPSSRRVRFVHISDFWQAEPTAVAGEEGYIQQNFPDSPEMRKLVNVIWLTHILTTDSHKNQRPDPTYSTEAHELGHILLKQLHDEGHSIMSAKAELQIGKFTPAQCEKMKTHPLLRKL